MLIKTPKEDEVLRIHRLNLERELRHLKSEIEIYENIIKKNEKYKILSEGEHQNALRISNNLRKRYTEFLKKIKPTREDSILEMYRLHLEIDINETILLKGREIFTRSERERIEERISKLKKRYFEIARSENIESIDEGVYNFLKKLTHLKFPMREEFAKDFVDPRGLSTLERKELIRCYRGRIILTRKGLNIYQNLRNYQIVREYHVK
ncbi:MAG: hypothetical protein ACE5HW_06675 [Candidatus Methanofastidiosia archaeon]